MLTIEKDHLTLTNICQLDFLMFSVFHPTSTHTNLQHCNKIQQFECFENTKIKIKLTLFLSRKRVWRVKEAK